MINRFDVTLEKNDNSVERKNIYSSDVMEIFNNIPWQQEYQEHLASEEEFGSWFYVSYKNTAGLEYSLDVELYYLEEEDKQTTPISYTVSYSYQEERTKKKFFGLFGEKQVIEEEYVWLDKQSYESVLKYLQAFLRRDNEFLKKDMEEKYQASLDE